MHLNVPTKCNENMPVYISILNIEEHPWHLHPDTLEIIYVLNGSLDIKRSIYNSHLTAGDISVVNPDIIHHITAEDKNITLIFHFDVAYFESHFTNLYDMIFVCDSSSNEGQIKHFDALRKHLTDIYYDYLDYSSDNEDSLLTNCISCLSILMNHFCEWQQNDNTLTTSNPYKKNPVQLDRLMRIVNYMYTNYQNKITLDDLAKSEYVSKYYISRIVSEGLGMSFQTYLNLIRVELAQEYLYGTDWSINTISDKCGFSSPGFFRKTYEHYTGLTPLADRKKAAGHVIDSTPMMDTDLFPVISEDMLYTYLGAPSHHISDHLSISKELQVHSAEVDISRTKAIRTNSRHCCVYLSSAAELLSADTTAAIQIVSDYGCVNTFSIDWSLLRETFSYLGNWDFLNQLFSVLDSNNMDLLIINNTGIDCQTDAVYESLTAYIQNFAHIHRQLVHQDEIFRFEDGNSLDHVSCATANAAQFIMLPLFSHEDGCPALFDSNNMKNPWFYSFFALNHLGSEILAETEEYIITRQDDSLKILLLNHSQETSGSEHRNFMFTLKNLKRDYTCCKYNITSDSGDESAIAESLGSAALLDHQIRALIDRKAFPEFSVSVIEASPEYNLHVASPAESVTLIELI